MTEEECVLALLAVGRELVTVDQHAMKLASERRRLIRKLIDEYGWSQHDIARALDISQARVSQMLTGKKRRLREIKPGERTPCLTCGNIIRAGRFRFIMEAPQVMQLPVYADRSTPAFDRRLPPDSLELGGSAVRACVGTVLAPGSVPKITPPIVQAVTVHVVYVVEPGDKRVHVESTSTNLRYRVGDTAPGMASLDVPAVPLHTVQFGRVDQRLTPAVG